MDFSADPKNCGACGHDCLGGACMAGACQPVAIAPVQQAYEIAADNAGVYWTLEKMSMVATCAATGCGAAPGTLASGQAAPHGITTSNGAVYWVNRGAPGAVVRCASTGCPAGVTTLVSGLTTTASHVAVDATDFFWTETGPGTVSHCSLTGCVGAPGVLAASQPTPSKVVVAGSNLVWGSTLTTMHFCALPGCAPVTDLKHTAANIVADGATIFWADTAGSVNTCSLPGCVVTPIAAEPGVLAVTIDATRAYWLVPAGQNLEIKACPRAGCQSPPTVLASMAGAPLTGTGVPLASNDVAIYWLTATSVMMLAK
jgi:hypothetical protein